MTCDHDAPVKWRWRGRPWGIWGNAKYVRGTCTACGVEVYAETEFGVWVERNKVATRLGARCWIQDTPYADACSCHYCHEHEIGSFKVHGTGGYY